MAAPTSTPTPKPTALGPATDSLPGVWPQIVCTVGDPVKGHPEGYYIQENRYSSRIWIQGRPPTTAPAPAAETPTPAPEAKTPTPGPKKTIFD
ncbi:MAG TPA: hypothetical protein VMQ76_05280 [Terracidiphilus sp.]|jgi:hypothetical protein|nr:hypothetical protein [Terracidiphilus sp.]